MDEQHVTTEPGRIVTSTLVLRSWSAQDAPGAFEMYGDPRVAEAIGLRNPVSDLAEMRDLLPVGSAVVSEPGAARPVGSGGSR